MEINNIIKVCYNTENPDYEEVLKYCLPAAYKEFKDIFLKKRSNTLPPPRDYNY